MAGNKQATDAEAPASSWRDEEPTLSWVWALGFRALGQGDLASRSRMGEMGPPYGLHGLLVYLLSPLSVCCNAPRPMIKIVFLMIP